MRTSSLLGLLMVIVSSVDGSVLNKYCQQDACLKAVQHPPRNEPGCSSFFKKTVTPRPKTVTAYVTTVVRPTKTLYDTHTVEATASPKATVTFTTTTTSTSTTDAVVPKTDTTTVPTTIQSITTDVSTTTTYESTTTTTTIVLSVGDPIGGGGLGKRYYTTVKPACPTTSAPPSKLPTYAKKCYNTAAYSSACSCVGAKHGVTTLHPCTTTVTSTITSTRGYPVITHVATTVTHTLTLPQITSTTTTSTTKTVTTSTSTSTSLVTKASTITEGVTTVSTTTTVDGGVLTTTKTDAICSKPTGGFKLEIQGAADSVVPVPLQLAFTGDDDPDKRLITTVSLSPLPQEFELQSGTNYLQTVFVQGDPDMIIRRPAFSLNDANAILYGIPADSGSFITAYLKCRISDPSDPNALGVGGCRYPLICQDSPTGATVNFAYCTTGTPGLRGRLPSPSTGCSLVTVDVITFPA